MQVGKICLNKGFLEVLKPENKQKKSTVSVQSVENADNLTRQEEQKEENTNLDILKNLKTVYTVNKFVIRYIFRCKISFMNYSPIYPFVFFLYIVFYFDL